MIRLKQQLNSIIKKQSYHRYGLQIGWKVWRYVYYAVPRHKRLKRLNSTTVIPFKWATILSKWHDIYIFTLFVYSTKEIVYGESVVST